MSSLERDEIGVRTVCQEEERQQIHKRVRQLSVLLDGLPDLPPAYREIVCFTGEFGAGSWLLEDEPPNSEYHPVRVRPVRGYQVRLGPRRHG